LNSINTSQNQSDAQTSINKTTDNNYNPSVNSIETEISTETNTNEKTKDVLLTQSQTSQRPSPLTDYTNSEQNTSEIYSEGSHKTTQSGVKYNSNGYAQSETNQPKSFDILTPIFEGQQAPLKVNGLTNLKDRNLETKKDKAKAALKLDSSLNEKFDPLAPVVPLFYANQFTTNNTLAYSKKDIPKIDAKTDPRCARFGPIIIREKPRRYIDGFVSLGYSRKLLTANVESNVNTRYIEDRLLTETPEGTLSAGARYSLVFDKGLAFRTGIVFTQISEI